MDRYNLLDEDDFFSQISSDKEKNDENEEKEVSSDPIPEKPPLESTQDEELEDLIINVDDEDEKETLELIDDTAIEPAAQDQDIEDASVEILEDEPVIDDVSANEEPPIEENSTSKKSEFDDYYLDAQQEGVNAKPIIIIIVSLLLLAIIGFVIYNVFMSEEETPPPVVEEVKKPSPEELHRLNFLSAIANNTQNRLSKFLKILSFTSKKTKITSAYIYGEDFIFEIYCSSRSELGRFNMNIREKYSDHSISLKTSQVRPGTKGGIFGVYSVVLSNVPSTGDSTLSLTSGSSFESWLNGKINQENLKLINFKNTKTYEQDHFRVLQYEGTVNGDYQSCVNLISSLNQEKRNIEFYKLTTSSRNLKSFSSKRYQLSFVIRLYL